MGNVMTDLAKYIEHTNLKPFATSNDILTLCGEAEEYQFYSVCVNPVWVPLAMEILENSDVIVCAVVGFPLGATTTSIKIAEAEFCIDNGATEIDMVVNIGDVKSGNWNAVQTEISKLSHFCHKRGAQLKVIMENCYLTESEIVECCESALCAGADFVKTSTGFGTGGATVEDVKLMRQSVCNVCKIKAAGGIKDRETALAMIEAGADRIGTSSGIAIVS